MFLSTFEILEVGRLYKEESAGYKLNTGFQRQYFQKCTYMSCLESILILQAQSKQVKRGHFGHVLPAKGTILRKFPKL